MGKGDDHAQAGADQRAQLVLRLGEAARRDRRALRLEGERLPLRERVEPRGVAERELHAQLLARRLEHLVGLPDEVRRAVEQRHEVAPAAQAPRRPASVGSREVGAPLGRGVDERLVDGVQRALRERRERAHGLDLVAEELDAERLPAGRREHVDDAAADGELAALLDLVDALVAGERELLGERVDARLVAEADLDRLRAHVAAAARPRRARAPTRRRARRPRGRRAPGRAPRRGAAAARAPTPSGRPGSGATRPAPAPRYQAGRLGRVAGVGVVGQRRRRAGGRAARGARDATSGSAASETRARLPAGPRRTGRAVRARRAPARAARGSARLSASSGPRRRPGTAGQVR